MQTLYVLVKRGTDIEVSEELPADINWDYDNLLQLTTQGVIDQVSLLDDNDYVALLNKA